MKDKAALILVTHNNFKILLETITSIYLYTNPNSYELFIIDNASSDDTLKLYNEKLINTQVIRSDENIYWAGGINKGLELTEDYKYIFFLNDDIEVYYSWLDNHIEMLNKVSDLGAIGPLNSSPRDWQCYTRVRKQFNYQKILPEISNLEDIESINNRINDNPYPCTYIKGMLAFFCVAFRRQIINKVGYLDERFIMGGDDDAYCRELEKHNYKLGLLLNTYVKHKAGVSIEKMENNFKKETKRKNIELLKQLYPDYY